MIEVYKDKLYVGNEVDLNYVTNDFKIIHAAKDPWHKRIVGFKGTKCPTNKYYYEDDRRCSLCIIDFPYQHQWSYFPEEMLKATMKFIDKALNLGYKVFIHCNKGLSRAPSLAFMYLVSRKIINNDSLDKDLAMFYEIYPEYRPSGAIQENIIRNYPFDYLK